MKGQILDVRVHIEPSKALLAFIDSLDNCDAMPENVLKIFERHGKKSSKKIHDDFIPKKVLSAKEKDLLKSIADKGNSGQVFSEIPIMQVEDDENKENDSAKANLKSTLNTSAKKTNGDQKSKTAETLLLHINDLRWLDIMLEKQRNTDDSNTYLHELLADCKLILPKNEMIPRNPELEARCQKLREEQQEREYRKMTKDVDATRQHIPEDTVAYQMKSINRQLVAVLQFVMSVIAGFAFGFIGLEYMLGDLDFGFRLFMGVMCALIIALAEIYFLAKKLSEYDQVVDEVSKPAGKPSDQKVHQHQD